MSWDRQTLEELLEAMLDELEGDWLLIGGALAALWLEPRRTTEDIDIVGMEGTQAERLRLMQFAEARGLPIEAVNTAADFFVRRIEGWDGELELFREGPRARIYRPNATLFLLLKMRRLSEQDLGDCLALLEKVRAEHQPLDEERVLGAIADLDESTEPEARERRQLLIQALTES